MMTEQQTQPALADIEGSPDTAAIEALDSQPIAVRRAVARLAVTGSHRVRFIHNMCTTDIKGLAPGGSARGMVVNDKGGMVALARFDSRSDAIWITATGPEIAAVEAQLTKYRVADDVQFAVTPRAELLVVGSRAADCATKALTEHATLEANGTHHVGDDGVFLAKLPLGETAAMVVDAPDADSLDRLAVAMSEAGAHMASAATWAALRVTLGWPALPVDLDAINIPLEASALHPYIDWDKGCYIGQEVIAMMHYRGRPNKHLVGCRFAGGIASDRALMSGDKTAGRLGTAVSLGDDQWIALAWLKRRYADGSRPIALVDGRTVEIAALPWSDALSKGAS